MSHEAAKEDAAFVSHYEQLRKDRVFAEQAGKSLPRILLILIGTQLINGSSCSQYSETAGALSSLRNPGSEAGTDATSRIALENLRVAGDCDMSGQRTSSRLAHLRSLAESEADSIADGFGDKTWMTEVCDRYRDFLLTRKGGLYVLVLRRSSKASREVRVKDMLLSDHVATHDESVSHEDGNRRMLSNPELGTAHPTFWKALGLACHSFMVELAPRAKMRKMREIMFQHRHEIVKIDDMIPAELADGIKRRKVDLKLVVLALSKTGQNMIESMKDIEAIARARPQYDIQEQPVDFRNLPENLLRSEPGQPDYRHAIEFVAQQYGTLLGLEHDYNLRSPAHSLARLNGTFSKRRQQIYGLY